MNPRSEKQTEVQAPESGYGFDIDSLRYIASYVDWTIQEVCEMYDRTETIGVGTVFDLMTIAYRSVTGFEDLPEESRQTVGNFFHQIGLDLKEIDPAFPELTPEEYFRDVQEQKLMRLLEEDGKFSFEDDSGNTIVAALETIPGKNKADLVVAIGQECFNRVVAVREPESNPQKVWQAFDSMRLLEYDYPLHPADLQKAEAIREIARSKVIRLNQLASLQTKSADVEL